MRKIPTALLRDENDRSRVLIDTITPGCEWVLGDPDVVARRKWDGTCTKFDDRGRWWARREVKQYADPPANWQFEEFDDATGKAVGWEPIEQSGFHGPLLEAARLQFGMTRRAPAPGTYELMGPKINGNPEEWGFHALARHEDAEVMGGWATKPEGIAAIALAAGARGWEGVVFYGPDGQRAKIKAKDVRS